jgi:cell division protein FtsN
MEMATQSAATPDAREEAQQLLAVSAAPRRAGQAYIDSGLFRDRQTAGRLASRLGEIATASVEMETINDQFFYRLIVGPFPTNGAAEAALTRIKASGLSGAYIQPVSSRKR